MRNNLPSRWCRRAAARFKPRTIFQQLAAAVAVALAVQFIALYTLVAWSRSEVVLLSHQRLYRETAAHLRQQIYENAPEHGFDEALRMEFERLHQVNDELEPYLVDTAGTILRSRAAVSLRRAKISIEPFATLLSNRGPSRLTLADDPNDASGRTIVAVTPIAYHDGRAFLYLTIHPRFFSSLHGVRGELGYMRLFLPYFLFCAGVGGALVCLYIAYLSRHFRGLTRAARDLADGQYAARAPVLSEDEVGFLAQTFNDMASQIVSAEQKVSRTEELRRRLVGTVLHDLRAPLAAMQGFVDLLEHPEGGARLDKYVSIIRVGARRQAQLLASLSELTQLDVSEGQLHPLPLEGNALVGELVELNQVLARQRGVQLSFHSAVPSTAFRGDRVWLERAVNNVIRNAVLYTPSGGSVRVTAAADGEELTIEVRDTGVGIANDELDRVFEPFYRAANAAMNGEGSGLGLAIVRTIVERHGGAVTIRSEVKKGTTVLLRIPIGSPSGKVISSGGENVGESNAGLSGEIREPVRTRGPKALAMSLTAALIVLAMTTFVELRSWPHLFLALCQIALLWWPIFVRANWVGTRLRAGSWLLSGALQFLWVVAIPPDFISGLFVVLGFTLAVNIGLCAALDPGPTISRWAIVPGTVVALTWACIRYARAELLALGLALGAGVSLVLLASYRTRWGKLFSTRFALPLSAYLYILNAACYYECLLAWRYVLASADEAALGRVAPTLHQELQPFFAVPSSPEGYLFRTLGYLPKLAIIAADERDQPIFYQLVHPYYAVLAPLSELRAPIAAAPLSLRLTGGEPERAELAIKGRAFGEPATYYYRFASSTYTGLLSEVESRISWTCCLIGLLVTIGLARGVGLFARRVITNRLQAVVQCIVRIQRGDTILRLPVSGSDEIDGVSRALNEMLDVLSERQAKAQRADERLRELVSTLLRALQRPQERLSRCVDALGAAPGQLEQGNVAARELQGVIEDQLSLIEDLFLLTKIDLGEMSAGEDLCTLEELLIPLSVSGRVQMRPGGDAETEHGFIRGNPDLLFRAMNRLCRELERGKAGVIWLQPRKVSQCYELEIARDPENLHPQNVATSPADFSIGISIATKIFELHHIKMRATLDAVGYCSFVLTVPSEFNAAVEPARG